MLAAVEPYLPVSRLLSSRYVLITCTSPFPWNSNKPDVTQTAKFSSCQLKATHTEECSVESATGSEAVPSLHSGVTVSDSAPDSHEKTRKQIILNTHHCPFKHDSFWLNSQQSWKNKKTNISNTHHLKEWDYFLTHFPHDTEIQCQTLLCVSL